PLDAAGVSERPLAMAPSNLNHRAATCMKVVAGVLSVISGLAGGRALYWAWAFTVHGAKGGTEGWAAGMLLIAGWGMLYVAVAAWMVPGQRWPLIRWAGATFPAALIVYSAWAMVVAPSPLFLFTFVYGAGAGSFLI